MAALEEGEEGGDVVAGKMVRTVALGAGEVESRGVSLGAMEG